MPSKLVFAIFQLPLPYFVKEKMTNNAGSPYTIIEIDSSKSIQLANMIIIRMYDCFTSAERVSLSASNN